MKLHPYHLHSLALELELRTDGGEWGWRMQRIFCRHKTTKHRTRHLIQVHLTSQIILIQPWSVGSTTIV